MSELTVGSVEKIVQGNLPEKFNVQVLAHKPLGQPGKHRLKITDGRDISVHVVLDNSVSGISVPEKFSVIRISNSEVPSNVNPHSITAIPGNKFALLLHHYTTLRTGAETGSQIQASSNGASSGASLMTPPTQSRATSAVNGAPIKDSLSSSSHNNQRQSVKRNLDSQMAGPSPKKLNTTETLALATHMVNDLHTMINKYKIKVMVESKSPQRQINTRNYQGQVQDCILTDESGSIKLTAWQADNTAKLEKLIPGKTYLMESMRVQPVRSPQFNPTKHNFELTWQNNTVVTGPINIDPVRVGYNFTRIHDLHSMEAGSEVDILAWVRQAGEVIQFTAKSGQEYRKREVMLADNSGGAGSSINLVLWGDDAESFSHQDKIIAIKKANLKEFNGVKNLNYPRGSSLEVSPSCPELSVLEFWVKGMRDAIDIVTPGTGPSSGSAPGGPVATIQEIKDAMAEDRAEKKFTITGYPIKINTDNMWYRACWSKDGRPCRKKVTEDEQNPGFYSCRCGKKKIPKSETELRFMVNMNIMDATSHVWAIMFDAATLLNKTAQELSDLKDSDEIKFLEAVSEATFVQMNFTVTARVETYNGSPKLKFTLHSAERVWAGEESSASFMRRRWAEIRALEAELGQTHTQVTGVQVRGEAARERHV